MKNKRKKFIVCAIVLGIIPIAIAMIQVIQSKQPAKKGIWLNEQFYQLSENKLIYDSDNYIEEVKENEFRLVDDGLIRKATIQVDGKNMKTTFANGTVIETKVKNSQVVKKGDSEIFSSSVEYASDDLAITTEQYARALTQFHFHIYDKLEPKTKSILSWFMLFIGMFVYGLSILQILYPNEFFFFCSKWMFEEPKLSEEGELIYRIVAGCIAIIGWILATGLLDKWIIQ